MTRHLAKLLDMIWYISMGLFLGLTGGLVLSVIMTFRGAREIDASPGAEPFSDPMFAEYHNDAVAGYIGQNLFMVGGRIVLILFAFALLMHLLRSSSLYGKPLQMVTTRWVPHIQTGMMVGAGLLLWQSSMIIQVMNEMWPTLYDPSNPSHELRSLRIRFDDYHKQSETASKAIWIMMFFALALTPWSHRATDSYLQSSDGEKEDK